MAHEAEQDRVDTEPDCWSTASGPPPGLIPGGGPLRWGCGVSPVLPAQPVDDLVEDGDCGVRADGDPARADGDPARADGDPARADGDPVRADGDPARADGEAGPRRPAEPDRPAVAEAAADTGGGAIRLPRQRGKLLEGGVGPGGGACSSAGIGSADGTDPGIDCVPDGGSDPDDGHDPVDGVGPGRSGVPDDGPSACRSDRPGWAGGHRHGAVRPSPRRSRRERPPRRWC